MSAGERTWLFTQLDEELRHYENGDSWAQFLARSMELLSDEPSDGANERARKLLKRFKKVSNDPVYSQVTALRPFDRPTSH